SWHADSSGVLSRSRAINNKKGGVVNVNNANVVVHDNIFTHDTTGTLSMITMLGTTISHIYNNTFYNPSQQGTAIGIGNGSTADNTLIRNNLIHRFKVGITSSTLGTFTESNNMVYGSNVAFSGFAP